MEHEVLRESAIVFSFPGMRAAQDQTCFEIQSCRISLAILLHSFALVSACKISLCHQVVFIQI